MLASESRPRSPSRPPPTAPPTLPRPAASHDSPGSSPNARLPVAAAPTSPLHRCSPGALRGCGGRPDVGVERERLRGGHERDVERARPAERAQQPDGTVRRSRRRLCRRYEPASARRGSRRRAPARLTARPTAAARTHALPLSEAPLWLVSITACTPASVPSTTSLSITAKRVAARAGLVGDALVAGRARARVRGLASTTNAWAFARSLVSSTIAPCAPPAPNGHSRARSRPRPRSTPAGATPSTLRSIRAR